MKLRIRVPADESATDADLLEAAHNAAARQASAWTTPVHVGYSDGAHIFEVDAVPRVPGVTTANVAPELRPPRVL